MLLVRTIYSQGMKKRTLGELVQNVREQKGWTQEGMAEITGITRSTIANIEAGSTKLPKPKTLEKLERHLGLSKEEMLRAAGRLDAPIDEVLTAMSHIDRLSTQSERLAVFHSLPAVVRRAIRKLTGDFLDAATQGLTESSEPPVRQEDQ